MSKLAIIRITSLHRMSCDEECEREYDSWDEPIILYSPDQLSDVPSHARETDGNMMMSSDIVLAEDAEQVNHVARERHDRYSENKVIRPHCNDRFNYRESPVYHYLITEFGQLPCMVYMIKALTAIRREVNEGIHAFVAPDRYETRRRPCLLAYLESHWDQLRHVFMEHLYQQIPTDSPLRRNTRSLVPLS